MASLESPVQPDDLYKYRGRVPLTRPIFQGDVFEVADHACLPDTRRVAILTHPCSMREGVKLRDRITIAHVSTTSSLVPLPWKGHYRIMPLPHLDKSDLFWQINFTEVHTIRSDTLKTDKRIACLEDMGINLLQQRYIFYLTRYVVETDTLYESSANVITEIDLMEEWIDIFADHNSLDLMKEIEREQKEFDEYLTPFREDLLTKSKRAGVRRKVYSEIQRRGANLS